VRPRTALAALVAASVVVDLVFFPGFIASDDVLYTTAARELAETEPHPGDDTWRPLEAVVSVPPAFPGGELRIALLHARARGRSEFADVTVSVR